MCELRDGDEDCEDKDKEEETESLWWKVGDIQGDDEDDGGYFCDCDGCGDSDWELREMKEAMLRKLTDLMGEEDGRLSGVESGDEEVVEDEEITEDMMAWKGCGR